MASTYIKRVDTTDGNKKVWTWSAWVKLDNTNTAGQNMFSAGGNNVDEAQFKFANNTLSFFNDYATTGRVSSSTLSRLFRDLNGWYHFVWRHKVDETSNDDRWKIYINGERLQPSDYGSPTIPNEEGVYNRFTNKQMWFGARAKAQFDSSYQYFSGLMSHIHFCDGYAYDATDFGEYDANGVWTIKTSPSVNYGTHGFFILKDGNSVTDQSGNGNDCTVGGGTLTNTEDNPSNVFATWNPLVPPVASNHAVENGNTTVRGTTSANVDTAFTTLAVSEGKYYCEMKLTQEGNATSSVPNFGIGSTSDFVNAPDEAYYDTSGVNLYVGRVNSTQINHNGSAEGTSFSTAYDVGDIVGLALDLDSATKTLKFYINGTLNATININADEYCFICAVKADTNQAQVDANFGNGYFGTTAVASAGTNASGIGIFEYDVPTGYTALSTKGLNL